MYSQDFATMVLRERLAAFESPQVRFRREWEKQAEIERLKERLPRARGALKVATAQ